MPYQPTGRPSGRPRKDAPRGDDGKVRDDGPICPECFPDGWPRDTYDAGCPHGTWKR